MAKSRRWHLLSIGLILILSWWGLKDLWGGNLWSAHDIWHNTARFYHYTQALKDGQYLPMWISNLANGFGYPLFIFSYHLPWLVGAPLVWLGLPFFSTIKTLFFLSFALSGIFMYWYLWQVFDDHRAALIGAGLYLWAPYHFLTVYVSAAIGTAFAFMLVPVLFLGIHWVLTKRLISGIVTIGLATAGLMLSHLMTLVMIIPIVGLWVILNTWILPSQKLSMKLKLLKLGLITAGLGLGCLISAFYLLPMATHLADIRAHNQGAGFAEVYQSNFVRLKQLVYSPWGYGPIISNAKDGEICFQVGIAQWLAVLGALGVLVASRLTGAKLKFSSLVFNLLVIFGGSIFLMVDLSQPLWKFANQIVTLDYPFRLLLIAVFVSSILASWVIHNLPITLKKTPFKRVSTMILGLTLVGFLVIGLYTNRNHIRVNMKTDFPLDIYVKAETTTNTFHEYLPAKADSSLLNQESPWVITQSSASASLLTHNTRELSLNLDLPTDSLVTIHQFEFPGQQLLINDTVTTFTSNDQGLISIPLAAGSYHITIRFDKTSLMKLGQLLSILGLGLTVYLGFNHHKITRTIIAKYEKK